MKNWQFYRHMPVYLSSGRLLGRTEEVGHAADYLHVRQGRVFVYDWYIPFAAIQDVRADGVRLKATKSQLRSNGWNVPPESFLSHQGATPGYEYTSPNDMPDYSHSSAEGEETS